MDFLKLFLGINKDDIQESINEIKKTKTWGEAKQSESYQKLNPNSRLIVNRYYFDNIVQQSPKFQSLPAEKKDKLTKQWESQGVVDLISGGLKKPVANVPFVKGMGFGGEVVEKVAQTIEPKITQKPEELRKRTIPGFLVKDFPRQVAADFIRFYKPWNVLVFSAAAKIIKPALKPVGRFIGKHIPAKIKEPLLKEFTVGKGQPLAYQAARHETKLATAKGVREAEQVGKVLTTEPFTLRKLAGKEQRIVGKIFRGEAEKVRHLPKYQEYSSIANEGRVIMDKWSQELIKSGIPRDKAVQTIEENVGKYMARMYTTKMAKQAPWNIWSKTNLRLRLNGLKKRKELSAEVLKKLGEIKEPAMPTAVRVKEISETVANAKLFNIVSQNPEWVANSNLTGTMVKMAESPTMGALSGKWVVPSIAEDINQLVVTRTPNFALDMYSKALGGWKYMKVILNPATQVRNVMSNSILLDLSGTNHARQLQLFPKVAGDYLKKGKLYQQALEDGAIGGEFVGSEVARIKMFYEAGKGGNLSKLLNIAKAPLKAAAKVYQGSEQLAKMVKYVDVLEKGGTRKIAAEQAQKWLFNYNEIPNFIKVAKQGAPFITFTYKALPRLGEALVNNPMRIYKYNALANAWNSAATKMLDMTPIEYARQTKLLPPWLMRSIGGMPANLLMPYRDEFDRTQWLNLEYILPVGMAPEIAQKGIIKGFISNPFLNIYADLKANQDFAGKKIRPTMATRTEAIKSTTEYIYRQIAPSLFAPGIFNTKTGESIFKGGYSFEKLIGAIYRKPDLLGRTKGLTPALLDILVGIKITPLDTDEAEFFRIKEKQQLIEELQKDVFKLNHPSISDAHREAEAERIFKKMQKVLEEE